MVSPYRDSSVVVVQVVHRAGLPRWAPVVAVSTVLALAWPRPLAPGHSQPAWRLPDEWADAPGRGGSVHDSDPLVCPYSTQAHFWTGNGFVSTP
jgi:hypothetical protein